MSKLTTCKTCGQQIAKTAKTCPSCGAKHKPPTSAKAWVALGLVITVVLSIVYQTPMTEEEIAQREAERAERAAERAEREAQREAERAAKRELLLAAKRLIDQVELDVLSWERGGFDNVMILDAKITNTSPATVRDPLVRCQLFGASGTEISRVERVIYQKVPRGESITVRDHNMGLINSQAQKAFCKVVDVSI